MSESLWQNAIRTQFISTFTKSSISISLISFVSFKAIRKRRESLSTISCFLFKTCRTLKSKKRIYVNHRVTKTFNKLTIDECNWVTKILTFIFITKLISYNQNRIFFRILIVFDIFVFLNYIFFDVCSQITFIFVRMSFIFMFLH